MQAFYVELTETQTQLRATHHADQAQSRVQVCITNTFVDHWNICGCLHSLLRPAYYS